MTKSIIDVPKDLWKDLQIFKLKNSDKYRNMNELVLEVLKKFSEENKDGNGK